MSVPQIASGCPLAGHLYVARWPTGTFALNFQSTRAIPPSVPPPPAGLDRGASPPPGGPLPPLPAITGVVPPAPPVFPPPSSPHAPIVAPAPTTAVPKVTA